MPVPIKSMKNNKSAIIAEKSPVRISFGNGGDTDYYTELLGKGNCINATINLFSHCELRKRDDSKIVLHSRETGHNLTFDSPEEIDYNSRELNMMKAIVKYYGNTGIDLVTFTDVPLESGLGGSAAHVVSMIKAFDKLNNIQRSLEETAKLAYSIERNELKIGGGYQDQWATSYTGINYMEFLPGKVEITPLELAESFINELEKRILLVYIKRKKTGHEVHDDLKKSSKDNLEILKEMGKNILFMKNVLEEEKIEKLGPLLAKDWSYKKHLIPCISNSFTDKIYEEAIAAGASGGRFVGAGAGGCAFFFCDDKDAVLDALKKFNIRVIPFKFFFQRNR